MLALSYGCLNLIIPSDTESYVYTDVLPKYETYFESISQKKIPVVENQINDEATTINEEEEEEAYEEENKEENEETEENEENEENEEIEEVEEIEDRDRR